KMEGGGVLPADRLFATMLHNHQVPDANPELMGARLSEAVDNLVRKEYAEVRLESVAKNKKWLSLYDFGQFGKNVQYKSGVWKWKKGECPVVALTDEGTRYVELL
ncbi:MAG TPA: hypothetical protein VFJ43_16630, partial [Bacteroidia bacterium]|nr:hypothetical protein [Bacteroidia bacterium]